MVMKLLIFSEFKIPKKTHTPIIALTAHVGDENKKRCIDAGMNAVLTKPLTAKSCADIVDAFIPSRKKEVNASDAYCLVRICQKMKPII